MQARTGSGASRYPAHAVSRAWMAETHEANNGRTPRMSWRLFAPSTAWNALEKRCVPPSTVCRQSFPNGCRPGYRPNGTSATTSGSRIFASAIEATKREAFLLQIGRDGWDLLQLLRQGHTPSWLVNLPALEVLRRVWIQQYGRTDETITLRVVMTTFPLPLF